MSANHFWRTDGTFSCINCLSSDSLNYNETKYQIECHRCNILYDIADVSHGHDLWVEPLGYVGKRLAVPITLMTIDHLNDAIATLILDPDQRKGSLEKLIRELERRGDSDG